MASDPKHRPTAKQALEHTFFSDYANSLDDKNPSFTKMFSGTSLASLNTDLSKESLGSLSLVTKKPLLNGRIDTIEKISQNNLNSAGNLDIQSCLTPRQKQASKFSNTGNNAGGDETQTNNTTPGKKKAGFFQTDLHKQAIINNLAKKDYEEEKK